MVFFDNSMIPENHTPKDAEMLIKLERLLGSVGDSKTLEAKFELLCSAAYRGYPVKSLEMMGLPGPPDSKRNVGHKIGCIMQELRKRYSRSERKSERRSLEEEGSGRKQGADGKQPTPSEEATDQERSRALRERKSYGAHSRVGVSSQ